MNDNMIISDELLAAFLDGNTNAEDTMRVLKAAEQDEELRELMRRGAGRTDVPYLQVYTLIDTTAARSEEC